MQLGGTFCVICGPLGGVDFLWNVVLFVPLGATIAARGARPWKVLLLTATASAFIEACQWRLIPGRDATLGDLLANSMGGLLGALVIHYRASILQPSPTVARRMLVAWSAVVAVIGLGAAWMMKPAAPIYVYWSQWAPERAGFVPFAGALRRLSLFGEDIPVGTTIDPTYRSVEYRKGELEVAAVVLPAPPVDGAALIARAGNPLGEQFQLAQRGKDLVVRGRANAAQLGFRSPSFRLVGGLAAGDGSRTIRMRLRSKSVYLQSTSEGDSVASSTAVTVGRAWQSVAPWEVTDLRWEWLMTALWVALLFGPIGYWSAGLALRRPIRSGSEGSAVPKAGRAQVAVVLSLAIVFLLVAPWVVGIAIGGSMELVGVLAGALSGAALHTATRARPGH